MLQIGQSDLEACLETVHAIGEASTSGEGFARGGVACLKRLVPSELTTLSVCHLGSRHRSVMSDVPGAISRREIEAFDRRFDEHPLVREHVSNPRSVTQRISDVMPEAQFRCSPLFDEYYRPIGIDHVMAVPVHIDPTLLVSFVFNRQDRDFSDRDRDRAEAIRPHLGNLYRMVRALDGASVAWGVPSASPVGPAHLLTEREREVLHWLGSGKTDKDIGEILAISPRTVHKHLQSIYAKLGVETRTAAVVRAMKLGPRLHGGDGALVSPT